MSNMNLSSNVHLSGNANLTHQTYGKHRVRISKIRRDPSRPDHHEFIEASVNVELEGDFDAAYTEADNRSVIATDTCKNTVYAIGKDDDFSCIESFATRLAEHFIKQYSHVNLATISATQNVWSRLNDCPHAFTADHRATPTATAIAARNAPTTLSAGIEGLMIAKTTQSGFANFHQDEYRTLADTDDRILATSLTAVWDYQTTPTDAGVVRQTITDAMLSTFIDHYSNSVQETLMRMGAAVLAATDSVSSITLTMPNKHHIPVDLSPLGRENHNDVFAVTDEPFGFIKATVGR